MNAPTSNGSHVVFGEFLALLRRQGFPIGVDHHIRLQELLNKISGHCAPSDLKTFLCPIFATNNKQQEQFYSAFDSYFDMLRPLVSEEEAIPGGAAVEWYPLVLKGYQPVVARKWPYVLAGTLLLILIVVLASFISPKHSEPESISPPEIAQTAPESEPQPQVEQKPPSPTSSVEQSIAEQPEPSPPQSLEPQLSFFQRYGKTIRLTVVVAPLIFLLFYEWYRFNRRKLLLQKQRGKKPPYVWPMRVDAYSCRLYDSEEFYTAARLLRRRQVDEFRRLDVNATIAATVESLGYPRFRYKPDSKPPEYLVLIDRSSVRDHQAQLFNELVNALEREGIFIGRYFYDGDPRVCYSEKGDWFHLEELHDRHAGHRLLIFGDGEEIIDPITGKLESWAAVFLEWQDRAVLTPEPPGQWGLREITLASEFILLPAKVDALLVVVDQIESSVAGDLRIWRQNGSDTPPRELSQPGVVEALRKYLGEETFQWLCACAVYPELQWDLTMYMASLPCMVDGLVKEKNLLQLTRLPYFRSGTMPDDLRWRLISELDRDKEKAIRSAIINLLEKNPPPKETFAADSYQLNLVVQRWLYRRSRKSRREMLRVLREASPSRVDRDYALLRFLESPRSSPLDLILPRHLRKFFYRDGIPAFGLKTSARFVMTLVFVVLAWIAVKPPASPKSPDETAPQTEIIPTSLSPGMALIRGSTFWMGTDDLIAPGEWRPAHLCVVQDFFMDLNEVTNEEYSHFVRQTGHSWPPHWRDGNFPKGEAKIPVYNVTWFDAKSYAAWVGKRLPTEAEWEYAARGTDNRIYPWGNEWSDELSNSGEDKRGKPVAVGSFPRGASPWGILDMMGNVAEWVEDDFNPYPGSTARPVPGYKVYRGGSYAFPKSQLATFARWTEEATQRLPYVGFRCVTDVPGGIGTRPPLAVTAGTQDRNAAPRPLTAQNMNANPYSVVPIGILIGVVRDTSGDPIPDVNIILASVSTGNRRRTSTNANGAFRIGLLTPDVYTLISSKAGYIVRSSIVQITSNSTFSYDVKLEPAANAEYSETTGAIEGRIISVSTSVIPGARITVTNEASGLARTTITDSNGDFFVSILPAGLYTVNVSKKGYLETSIRGFAVRLSKVNSILPPITLRPATGTSQTSVKSKKPGRN